MRIALIIGLTGLVFIMFALVNNLNLLPAQSQRDTTNTKSVISPIVSSGEAMSEAGISMPVRVRIPSIEVDTIIESVGVDSEGRMDVPKDAGHTSWFSPGFKPGEKGNAVLAGHFDREDGSPAVFWDLSKLQNGDEIIVEDERGEEFKFAVINIQNYPYDDFPMEEVFGANDKARLNLITCRGEWNTVTNNYSHRTVVFSELKSSD